VVISVPVEGLVPDVYSLRLGLDEGMPAFPQPLGKHLSEQMLEVGRVQIP
jgi:hypothetical protein